MLLNAVITDVFTGDVRKKKQGTSTSYDFFIKKNLMMPCRKVGHKYV